MQKIIAAFCIKNDRTFCKNPFFHSISGNERKTFGLWDKNCLQGCENCIVRDLGNILARKNFCPKKCNFPSSSDIRRIFCGRRSKTAIYVSIGTFLLEFSSWKELNFSLLLEIERKFFGLLENVVDGPLKTVLCVYIRTFDGLEKTSQYALKKLFFWSFCNFERNILASWAKLLGKIVRIPLYVIIGTFWVETVCWRRFIISTFLDNERKLFGLLENIFDGAIKTVFCVYRRTFEGLKKLVKTFSKSFLF